MISPSHPRRIVASHHIKVVAFFLAWSLVAPVSAADSSPAHDIGDIRLGHITAKSIAIPSFGAPGAPTAGGVSETIYRNLELSGHFKRPTNMAFVEQTHRNDLRTGKINFAEWSRLGAKFLAVGGVTLEGGKLKGEIRVYDANSGSWIFGMEYPEYPSERLLGQRMADDILYRITGEQGLSLTRIAFVAVHGAGVKELWTMDADGGGAAQMSKDKSLVLSPCWGMNGNEIYYTSYKDRNPDLCGTYIDGRQSWFISRYPTLNVSPDWSEAAQRIVLILSKDGNSEIYTMDRNGKGAKRLTYTRAIESSPSWSPNGKRIVFTSNRSSGRPRLYTMSAEGLSPTLLSTSVGTYNTSPAWSPEGDLIAFVGRRDGVLNIYTIAPDGTGLSRLTQAQGNNEDPAWSPDGTHLSFTSDRTGRSQVYVMNIDGSNQRRLTNGSGAHSPSWGPLRTR